MTFSMLNTQ